MAAVVGETQIVESRVLRAPRELVFRMFTDAEHVSNWWGPRGFRTVTKQMDVKPGGKWLHTMIGPDGTEYINEVRYEVVDEPSRLVYEHISDPYFRASISFVEKGEAQTEVTFVMEFVERKVRDAIAESRALEGLADTLARFEEVVGTLGSEEFVLTRELKAPAELVYRAWTEPERLKKWFGPIGSTLLIKSADIREGGTMHYGMQLPDGKVMWGLWQFRDLTPYSRIVTIAGFADEHGATALHPMAPDFPREMLSSTTFEEKDGKTLVTLRSRALYAGKPQQEVFARFFAGMTKGWGGTLDALESYLAEEQTT